MRKRSGFWPIFLRTLAVVLAFWLAMAAVLTANNLERQRAAAASSHEDVERMLSMNIRVRLEDFGLSVADGGDEAEIWRYYQASIQWLMTQESFYRDTSLGMSRLYDPQGNDLARSQLAMGMITTYSDLEPAQEDVTDSIDWYYLLFDPVLTDQEQVAMAQLLREDLLARTDFHGTEGPYRRGEGLSYAGLYGEVTGIVEGEVIYPQKLVLHFEQGPVTLADSGHAMFQGTELVTLKFDYAAIFSALAWGDPSPRELLKLYHRGEELLDNLVENRPPSSNGSSNWYANDGQAGLSTSPYILPGHPLSYAFTYSPWRLAVHGLGLVYGLTLLAALGAAAFISWTQVNLIRKERELTRAMAHELKTPAAVVRAYAEALREDVAPERREAYLDILMEESDRMGNLVGELLDLSRLSGASPLKVREEVDLKAMVERCFERLRLPMEERGLELRLSLAPAVCMGDGKRLERAISNLALNALRHAQPGPVEVKLTKDRVLTVENRCPPLPPQGLERLWEPFYTADEAREGEGSGLGLAIVDNIVRLHGGRRWVEATGEGVRFRISLPG